MKPEGATSEDSSNEDDMEMDSRVDFKPSSGYDPESLDVIKVEEANCIHEYIAPKGFKRRPFDKATPYPKEYKFELDTF